MIFNINIEESKLKGIYVIRNIINNKTYIGSTLQTFRRRYTSHLNSLNKNEHQQYLQNSFNKYGPDNFIFEILEINNNDLEIRENEEKYIKLFGTTDMDIGYNMTENSLGRHKGYKCSEEFSINKCTLTLEECFKIKELLLEYTNELIKDKVIRIASLFENGTVKNIGSIRDGNYYFSDKLGGGIKEWDKNFVKNREHSKYKSEKYKGEGNPNFGNGEKIKGEKNPTVKYKIEDCFKVKEMIMAGYTQKEIAESFKNKFTIKVVRAISQGNHWSSKKLGGSKLNW